MHLTNIYIKAEKLLSMRHTLSHSIFTVRHTAAPCYGRTLTMPNHALVTATTADTKSEKLAQRLSRIIARLHQGEHIDKHQLAAEFGTTIRTIERDLHQRLHGIAERNAQGQWQLTLTARSTIPARHLHGYARMAGTERLFPDASLPYLLGQLNTPEPHRATHVQPIPHEDLGGGTRTFAALQAAIEQQHTCHFTYKTKPRHAHPYRLIHKNGVWYLAAEEAGRLKNFSVALIEQLQVDSSAPFTPKRTHLDYIANKDDVWFTEQTTEVLLRIAPDIAHYFARRQLLPQQQHRQDSDGSLLVTTHINHINQLLPVVRYWLPHVRIVQPKAWEEELVRGLREVLGRWETPPGTRSIALD